MMKSLLAKARTDSSKAKAVAAGVGTVIMDDEEVDDAELLKASRGKKAGAQAPKGSGKDVAMASADADDAYDELLPDTFEGYHNSLQLGPDEDDEQLMVR